MINGWGRGVGIISGGLITGLKTERVLKEKKQTKVAEKLGGGGAGGL